MTKRQVGTLEFRSHPMATAPEIKTIPELHSGDHMSREEFHAIYEQTPEDFRAELIGGIVYVASPLKRRHGTDHPFLTALFVAYAGHTPGIEVGDNATVLLGHECEPQPDLLLRILPEFGGQSETTDDDYIKGPPELVAEIAHSSRANDLHSKYEDYRKHGVREYLVICLNENEIRWFDLKSDTELQPEKDGIIRVQSFPGLWINPAALLARDYTKMMATLEQGMTTDEHKEFAQHLKSQQQT